MESASLLVSDFISAHHLPDDPQSFLEEFCSADKKYLDLQEGTLWDYKKRIPLFPGRMGISEVLFASFVLFTTPLVD